MVLIYNNFVSTEQMNANYIKGQRKKKEGKKLFKNFKETFWFVCEIKMEEIRFEH